MIEGEQNPAERKNEQWVRDNNQRNELVGVFDQLSIKAQELIKGLISIGCDRLGATIELSAFTRAGASLAELGAAAGELDQARLIQFLKKTGEIRVFRDLYLIRDEVL